MLNMLMTIGLVGFLGLFIRLYRAIIWEPKRLRSLMKKQGIDGPPPKFLLGNLSEIKKSKAARKTPIHGSSSVLSHNCSAFLFSIFEEWRKQYGPIYVFSLGTLNVVYVHKPDVVKEIATNTSLDLGKPSYQQREHGPLLGQGILTSNGAAWSHQRKILAPELYMEKVKGMLNIVTESALRLVDSWNSRVDVEGTGVADINIDEYMRNFSGDVISRACFGGNYAKGEEIFLKLRTLQEVTVKKGLALGIPGMRYLPTKNNRESWALQKEVRRLILKVVKERKEAEYEKDLLQMVLESAEKSDLSQEETDRFIVDNCKNIYLAGFETTAVSSTWTLMLLASNPEWQSRVRDEVLEVCKGQIPSNDMLLKMKQLTMVIHESLRLYSPVPVISREAFTDMKFRDLHIPKGVCYWNIIHSLHTDPEVWGPDAYEFNPNRFANGITGACKYPQFYLPFGVGPRVCLGQNLAIVELKVLVSLLVSNFFFSLSPDYVHSPCLRLVIEPENGVQLLVKKL